MVDWKDMNCTKCKTWIWFYETMVTEYDAFKWKYNLYHYRCYDK